MSVILSLSSWHKEDHWVNFSHMIGNALNPSKIWRPKLDVKTILEVIKDWENQNVIVFNVERTMIRMVPYHAPDL